MLRRLLIVPLLAAGFAHADSASDAVAGLTGFMGAWNTGDNVALRKELNYPHLTLVGDGRIVVAQTAKDFTTDFDRMRDDEDWHHSTFDDHDILMTSPEQVHLITTYSRHDSKGEAYRTARVYYIVTKSAEGHWGMQFRAPIGNGAAEPTSEEAARKTIQDFFVAWNNADNPAIHKSVNFPHAFVVRGGRASIAEGPTNLVTDFDRMREREGWHRSDYHGLQFVYSDETKAFTRLTFTRHHPDGELYRTVPVMWLMTKQDDAWGLQLRAIFPALESN